MFLRFYLDAVDEPLKGVYEVSLLLFTIAWSVHPLIEEMRGEAEFSIWIFGLILCFIFLGKN